MDGASRTPTGFVPDRYLVRVNPADLAGLGDTVPGFADALVAHARSRGYPLQRRPLVELSADPGVSGGDVMVDATFEAAMEDGSPDRAGPSHGGSDRPPADGTMVFEVPMARVPYATLLVRSPGVAPREFPVRAASVRIGRGDENDLVLPDSRVSRRHGLLSARQGGLVYTDLGSTNGSFVNAGRVSEVALGSGDVLQLGDSTVTVAPGR